MSMSAEIGHATRATSANSVSSGVTSAASASSHAVAEPVAGPYPDPRQIDRRARSSPAVDPRLPERSPS